MAGKLDIGPRIGIEGEAEYRKQMANIIQQAKTLDSEMKLVTSAFTAETSAQEKASAQSAVIAKQIENQKNKISELEKAYERASAAYGENDNQTLKLKESLNKASAELNNMEGKLADVSKSSEGLDAALQETEKESTTFKDVLKANLTADFLEKGFDAAINAAKALANGIKDAVSTIGETISETAAAGDAIDKQSQKIQVSAEEYQKLAFAAERSGASISSIETANKSLQKSDFEGNIYDAILAVSSLTDADERAAKASELFGAKSGQELLPLLNSGAEGVQALFDEVENLGGVMSNEAVAASAAYEDSLTNLQTAFGGLKNNLASEFLPSITSVMDGFTMILSGKTDEGVETIKQGIEDFETQAQELGPIAEDMLNLFVDTVVELLPDVLDAAGDVIITLCDGILKMVPELVPVAAEVINKICDFLIDNLDLIIDLGVDIIVTLAESMSEALPQLLARLPEITAAIIKGLGKIVTEAPEIGANLIRGLWEGIGNMEAWIISKVKGFGRSVLNGLKDFFGIHSPSTLMEKEIGNNLGLGIVNGFEKTMSKAQNDIKEVTKKAFDIKKDALSAITFTSDDILQMAVGLKPLDMAADLNADGIVSAADARIAMRQSAGISSSETVAAKSYSYGDINVNISVPKGMDPQEVAKYVIEEIRINVEKAEAFA